MGTTRACMSLGYGGCGLGSAVREGACMRTLFIAVSSADVASQRPNSVKAEAATVMGKTETLRMRLRSSGSTIGRMAANTVCTSGEGLRELGREKRDGLGTLRCTCRELIVSQRVVVDARPLAGEDCISERTLVQMSHERPRAARAITDSKEETFNGSDKDPLLTSVRAAASAIDEAEDGEVVLFAGEGDGEALRGDGSGHWG